MSLNKLKFFSSLQAIAIILLYAISFQASGQSTVIWSEDFEDAGNDTYTSDIDPIPNLANSWSYEQTNAGRLRMRAGAGFYHGGGNAATLDVTTDNNVSINYIIATIDLDLYKNSNDLYLSFAYMHHGEESHSNDRVWIRRGNNNTNPWIEIYDLYNNRGSAGSWNEVSEIPISAALATQPTNQYMQIRFGQEDNYRATSTTANDGFSFDDISITEKILPDHFGLNPGLVFWLKGDLGVTGTNPITNWADQSGNGNNASPSPSGPVQITSVNMNSQKTMLFDGSKELVIGNYWRINTGTGYNGDERSMLVAFTTGADISTVQYIYEEGGGTNGLGVFIKNGAVYATVYNGGGVERITVFEEVSTNTAYVLSFIWDNGTLKAKINNLSFQNQTSNGSITTLNAHGGAISIGYTDGGTRNETGANESGPANFSGEIAEILYYDLALSTSEETSLISILEDRYGIVEGNTNIYYSYQTGNWSDPTTWTSDPGGTTQVGSSVPGSSPGDVVVILSDRTVFLDANVSAVDLKVNIDDGGFLDMKTYAFSSTLKELNGQGFLRLASTNFPTATSNSFVNAGGGTTEYYNTANFTLPVAQIIYNNLHINAPGVTATQLSNISLNGNLHVKQGVFRINDNSVARRQLTINGDVAVDAGASWIVGAGNTTDADFSGGTAPFTDYYDKQTHRIVVSGDFMNNGTVRFTNQTHPVYNAFPTNGAATVYFIGATNNKLTCNSTTDLYNLVLDKGVDQTYSLTIYSSAYPNFRLFGRNDLGGENGTANPDLRKALWIRTGTLILQGLTIIPSLTEANTGASGSPNGDFYIPSNGALILDGTEVVVLSTADDYREVNAAYGVAATSNAAMGILTTGETQAFSIYGKYQVNNGYFSTRESGGLITWSIASGQLVINGGTVDTKQFRAAGGSGGLASFDQSGGTFVLRGRFQRNAAPYASVNDLINATISTSRSANGLDGTVGTFNLNEAANVFSMSGGTIRIYDACGTAGRVFDVLSAEGNINVTGGTVEFIPTTGSGGDAAIHYIKSVAPFGNVLINRVSSTTTVQLDMYPLTVLADLNLNSGVLAANDLDVSVGGDLTIATGTTYHPGTNWTALNGSGDQTFTNNLAAALTLNKFKVDKPSGTTLTLAGSQPLINVSDSVMIIKGTLENGGKTLNFTTSGGTTTSYLYNSGIFSGTGRIILSDNDPQIITGDGNGIFQNLELNNTDALTAPVSLGANMTINGTLIFSQDKLLDIKNHNLILGASATVVGASTSRYIQTNGDAGGGGVTKRYSTGATGFTFPVGAPSTGHATANYTPATINFDSNPTTFGAITVVPVGYEHPNTTTKGRSLTYFWRVKSSGFTMGSAILTHSYVYSENDVVTGTEVSENGYVSAIYNSATSAWTKGDVDDVDESTNTMGGNGTSLQGISFIDGEFTAGDDFPTNPFGTPTIYYSRRTGPWANTSTWSLTGHNGAPTSQVPGSSDIVIIGDKDSVYLATNNTNPNTGVRSCASLKIEKGSALDIGYNPSCSFGIVLNHENGNGNFRLTTSWNTGSTFIFPSGDFSDFNVNLGTTELYSTNPNAGTTYWLPNNITSYGNLIISPLGGSNIIFGNTNVTIYGNLVTRGQNSESWFLPTWNGNYPSAPAAQTAKTITILGDFRLEGGALIYYGNNNLAQDIVVYGDFFIDEPAGIQVYSDATNQSISIGGSLINNSLAPGGGVNGYRGCDFTDIPLTFFGSDNASITNTNTSRSPYTVFGEVTVNKGSSQATTLTIDIGGNLTTPNDDWLTLQNGTLRYMRTNPSSDFTISRGTAFTIPSTAGLYIDYPNNSTNRNILIANAASNTNDLFLDGKLTILSGSVYVGPTNGTTANNNDIEYSGGGAAAIEIQGGDLIVNGQIRRNPASTNGILSYIQKGGNVIINGQAAIAGNAKLEVCNGGSVFDMSGGTLTIVRGGGTTYGDLYLRAASSTVTGGEIIFTQSPVIGPVVDVVQDYILDANVPLNDLTITGKTSGTSRNATVTLLISPLALKGDLTISNNRSIFDANSNYNIDLTVKGEFTNNGTYNHYENLTTFSGGVQSVQGSTATDFYDLVVNPVTSLSLIRDITILNDLTLNSGQFLNSTYNINVKGNFVNNANYDGDPTQGGIILNGTSVQYVSGTGSFGRLELNNAKGARLLSDITLQKNLKLSSGILDINQHLLTLGQNSSIEGSGFSKTKMITSDGVYSNVGIRKYFGIYSGTSKTFTYPIGTSDKYTPVELNYTDNASVGYIRVNNINTNHPGVLDPTNVLAYYWEVSSFGITGLKASMVLNYLEEDVKLSGSNMESDYIGAALLIPGSSWAKIDNVDETANTITFDYSSGINGINAEFTAGIDPALPTEVPEFTSLSSGDWTDKDNWVQTGGTSYTLTGAPNGFIVIVAAGHVVTIDNNYATAYRTSILGELKANSGTYGHNLGAVSGNGILNLESGILPAGRYTDFFDCGNSSILKYGGSTDYTIIADLYSSVPRLHFTGTGVRTLPNKDLTVCTQLLIDGATLNNSVNNRKLTIQGTMERKNSGIFNSGIGPGASVSFAGSAAQTIGGILGDFTGASSFNNFEINNSQGVTVNNGGSIEIAGNLLLTDGKILTQASNNLTITNSLVNCVFPAGGTASSFVAGPMTKVINQGDHFQFPVGKGNDLGNKLKLSSTQTGTIQWTVEYFTPNTTYAGYNAPLSYVNSHEYWKVGAATGSQAIINIDWDTGSDLTPLNTQYGLSDMRIAKFDVGTSRWNEVSSSATGTSSAGTVYTSSKATIPVGGSDDFTVACINTIKPKAKLTPTGPVCGTSGIPITFTPAPALDYTVNYTLDGVAQTPITFTGAPYILPTPTPGAYKLTAFTYNGGNTGAVDAGTVIAYALPTTANAGTDQSLCGFSTTTLAGNTPTVGTGLWSIITGTGGTVVTPTSGASTFNGTNGTAYSLQWEISNGGCVSTDQVDIVFPILAAQPADFVVSSSEVCNLEIGVSYRVPLDPTVSYTWSYAPASGVTINGTSNTVTLDFDNTASDGILSVTAANGCGSSTPRTLGVTVHPVPVLSLVSDDADNLICTGNIVLFTANSSSGPAITNYDFRIDGASVQTGLSNTFSTSSLTSGNRVTVVAMAAGSCTTTSNEITMTIADGIWSGTTNSDWFNTTNWTCGAIPTQVEDVIIPGSVPNMPVINSAGAEFRDILIQSTATLTVDGMHNVDVFGDWTNDGDFVANSGNITFNGISTISGSGNNDFHNITINPTKTLTASAGTINILGNFINNGIYNNNNGTIALNGSTIQTIQGINDFYNLRINNSSGAFLNNDIGISNNLFLANGIINTNGNSIILGASATVIPGLGKPSSYVNGNMIKTIANAGDNFTFPIGSPNRYRPAYLQNVSVGGLNWEAEYFEAAPTNDPSVSNLTSADASILTMSTEEYWRITDGQSPGSASATVGLSWGLESYVSSVSTEREELRVMIWNKTNSNWDNGGGSNYIGGHTAGFGTFNTLGVVTFSEKIFTLGSTILANPLPVELVSFLGKEIDGQVKLNWETASEQNNDYFLIEHSIDGNSFNEIGKVAGAGTVHSTQNYSYIHRSPSYLNNYYRLKQVDFDGVYEYSDVILVQLNKEFASEGIDFDMHPNPANGNHVKIRLKSVNLSQPLTIQVINLNGLMVHQKVMDSNDFSFDFEVDFGYNMTRGIYMVRLMQSNTTCVRKLVLK